MKSVLPFNNKFDIPVKVAEGGTGATTAIEATNNLFAQSLAPDVDIPSNSDLNNYDTPGCYRIPNSDYASSITNTAITTSGYMLIVYSTYGFLNSTRLQIAMTYSGITYTRYRNVEGIWSSWTQRKYTDTTYGVATTSANGLMSKEDKTKLDSIAKSSSTSKLYMCGVASAGGTVYYNSSVYASGSVLYGAAWNDYAEFREITEDKIPYGKVLVENGDDTLSISTERLQPGGNICSDTFGFAIGETKKAKAPLAVSGRVLAYPYEARDSYKPGDAVCSGPNGTVSKMTREEIKEYPDRIIGFVSAIPNYEVWGEDNIKVNGRIWIKVK